MKKAECYLQLVIFLAVNGILAAFQWPVDNPVITATFGENRSEHFHNGIDIGGGAQPVSAIKAGEIIFQFNENSRYDNIPTGLGNFIVIEHEQEYRSVYAHLEESSMVSDSLNITASDTIGVIGNSGRSYGKHLHFSVIDNKIGQIINPLLVLPQLMDSTAPVIGDIFILRNQRMEVLVKNTNVKSGKGRLIANIYDPSDYVSYFCPMAPFSIETYYNGRVFSEIRFEALKNVSEQLVLVESGDRTFDELYWTSWDLNLGEITLSPGKLSLEIIVKDFMGNQSIKYLDVMVLE